MTNILKRLAGACIVFFSLFLFALQAHAATLSLSAKTTQVLISDKVEVDIVVNSEDAGFNAAQATLQFPKDILEVVSVDKSKSPFNFWLTEPTFSNDDGTVTFAGGSAAGFAGKSIEILKVFFRVKGAGTANLTLADGAVTASDGSGTNILSAMYGLTIISPISQKIGPTVELAPPVQITRKAVPSEKLPAAPEVTVPLYPISEKWYNAKEIFFASWTLPLDVTDVAAVVNNTPQFSPAKSEGLFEGKKFVALEDGVSFLHVRFKNNIGWGPVMHYRLGIDTMPPAAFSVLLQEGTTAQNPHRIVYQVQDALSGIDHFEISIDGGTAITDALNGGYNLTRHLTPGKHVIKVQATDKAGNVAEGRADVDIRPIASPTLELVSKKLLVGEGGLALTGKGVPNGSITLSVKGGANDSILYLGVAPVTEEGKWSFTFDQPLKKGDYFVEAIASDPMGAMSLPVRSELFTVFERPFITVDGVSVTLAWFFYGIIFLLLILFLLGWFSYHFWRKQMANRVLISERDVMTLSNLLRKDLDGLTKKCSKAKLSRNEISEIKFLLKRMGENIEKVEKYLMEDIGEIPQ